MIDIYARTFRIATLLDAGESVAPRRRVWSGQGTRLARALALLWSW